ncbi:MAG TPA: hypothetical protein VEG08_07510 [Terriglobales bacterium]|nr:hypothetical protein [Terriglobales bacterium]
MLLASAALAQEPVINPAVATQYFREAKALSEKDAGALWGVRLYGPTLLADPETRVVVANQADDEGHLEPVGEVYTGKLPAEVPIANTAVRWAGVEWTMIMWPLPRYRQERLRLMMHESFHRIQKQIGLPAMDSVNNHLDSRDGRVWLLLEWRALTRALWSTGPARRKAIESALYFRAYRRSLFPQAAANENALEMNEGLAEYTGYALSSAAPREFEMRAALNTQDAQYRQTFVRSFAYVSGPVYGCLLDESRLPWRKLAKKEGDLGALLARAYGIHLGPVTKSAAAERAARYDGDEVFALEDKREAQRQKVVAEYRARVIDGPVLVLPLGPNVQWGFDPNNVAALDENSTVYPTLHLQDDWGTLEVSKGALMVRENGHFARCQVSAPKDAAAREGEGWKLELKPGWVLAPGPRAGDFTVKREGTQ